MKKIVAVSAVIVFLFLMNINFSSGQNKISNRLAKDTTPIEDLDYKLDKQQFLEYYGIDDTAKALINMFYRKRGHIAVDYVLVPLGSYCVGGVVGGVGIVTVFSSISGGAGLLILGGVIMVAGIIVYPVVCVINRLTFTRERLLFTLVSRERGSEIPYEFRDKLQSHDFE